MNHSFDYIIWGASFKGIEKAIELKNQGARVILLNNYGFPGSDITEALSSYISTECLQNAFNGEIITDAHKFAKGILYKDNKNYLIHPESIKRSLWQIIIKNEVEFLFHVTPLKIEKKLNGVLATIYGKEGEIALTAKQIIDLSDDRCWLRSINPEAYKAKAMELNLFLKSSNHEITRCFTNNEVVIHSEIGVYIKSNHQIDNSLEILFNKLINQVINRIWTDMGIRPLMIPSRPALIF